MAPACVQFTRTTPGRRRHETRHVDEGRIGRGRDAAAGAVRYTRAVRGVGLSVLVLWAVVATGPVGAQTVEDHHLDALGSVRAVTDANGAVVRRHDFKPFGEEYASGQVDLGDRKLFTGQERDHETALDYFGARYYRADFGRFTTVDPVTVTPGANPRPAAPDRLRVCQEQPAQIH